jgi:hypothetical protein
MRLRQAPAAAAREKRNSLLSFCRRKDVDKLGLVGNEQFHASIE